MGTARSKQDKPTQTAMLPANNVARSESLAATADISAVLAKNRNGPEPTFRTTAALWIEHLTSLQRAGKTSELGHELTRFRERHPRAELPEALREIETRMKAAPQKFSDSNPPG